MFKFNTLASAQNFVDMAVKIMMIVLGDNGLYWVTTPREASRLEKQGYEVLYDSKRRCQAGCWKAS